MREMQLLSGTRVLLLNAESRKAVEAVRALGQAGADVTAVGAVRLSTAFGSRYCRRRIVAPTGNDGDIPAQLASLIERLEPHVVVPLDDPETVACGNLVGRSDTDCAFVTPPGRVLMRAMDKETTLRIAHQAGIPVPAGGPAATLDAAETIADEVGYPVIIKPRISQGSRGLRRAENPDQLRERFPEVDAEYPRPLIQEWIPPGGDAIGVSMVMDQEHAVRAIVVYRRLREFPVQGGPSTLRETVACPDAQEAAVRLLTQMQWHGPAMVEFRQDPRTGQHVLMEVNGRFWGALPLARAAGVDIVPIAVAVALGKEVQPQVEYELGVRCRWLLPGDMLWFLHSPDRFRARPSFFRFFDRGCRYDLISLTDPLPAVIYALHCACELVVKRGRGTLRR